MSTEQRGVWTRRRFLQTIGASAGGGAAAMNVMSAWGMLPAQALAQTEAPQLDGNAEGTNVIVIGTMRWMVTSRPTFSATMRVISLC